MKKFASEIDALAPSGFVFKSSDTKCVPFLITPWAILRSGSFPPDGCSPCKTTQTPLSSAVSRSMTTVTRVALKLTSAGPLSPGAGSAGAVEVVLLPEQA